MEDIKVGEYFRSKNIGIMKFVYGTPYITKNGKEDYIYYLEYKDKEIMPLSLEGLKDMKHSPNITDLIEVGDYVNGKKVILDLEKSKKMYNTKDDFVTCKDYTFEENEIKSVVTKEQFDSIKYEV